MTIVSPQVAERLFTFENRCRSSLFSLPSMAGHVGTVPTVWQSYFHRARGKSVRLRPNKRELLQTRVCFRFVARLFGVRRHVAAFDCADMSAQSKVGFAVAACYSLSHFASSRAQ